MCFSQVRNGRGVAASRRATVSVQQEDGRPVILQGPEDQHVADDREFRLTVVARGWAPLQYQWLKNGSEVEGATSAEWRVQGARKSKHQGIYTVQVGITLHGGHMLFDCPCMPFAAPEIGATAASHRLQAM